MTTTELTHAPHQVFIVDRHPWVTCALEQFIRHQPDFVWRQTYSDWHDLIKANVENSGSIVLLDWDWPGIRLDVIGQIRTALGQTKIVAMGTWLVSQQHALAAGADAYIHKTDSPQHVLKVLRQMSQRPGLLAD